MMELISQAGIRLRQTETCGASPDDKESKDCCVGSSAACNTTGGGIALTAAGLAWSLVRVVAVVSDSLVNERFLYLSTIARAEQGLRDWVAETQQIWALAAKVLVQDTSRPGAAKLRSVGLIFDFRRRKFYGPTSFFLFGEIMIRQFVDPYHLLVGVLGLAITVGCSSIACSQENWSQFRGDRADGVAPDNDQLPMQWSKTENVKWVSKIPGWGWSCPVVWKDRIFVTSVVADEENLTPSKGLYLGRGVRDPAKGTHHWMVHCFDLNTGKEIWKHQAHVGQPQVPRHPKSTYAAETVATDGQRVYALFGDLGLFCYDMDGKLLWSRKIDPKKTLMDYGAAASPVVHDGQVFVVYDNLEESWVAALDAATGEQNWKLARKESHSWATPFVWKNSLRTELVVPGKNRNRSYSLDGKLLWEFDGKMSSLVIPSPFAAHGMLYIASGYVGDSHRPTFAILPGAKGDITPRGDFADSKFIQWYQPTASSYNPTQIVYGNYLYTLYDQGFLTCHNAKTGERVYGKKRFTPAGSFTASPVAYNGHIFCFGEDGLTYVVKAGPEFEVVQRNELSELLIACPAVAQDKLLIRTASRLYCITKGAK